MKTMKYAINLVVLLLFLSPSLLSQSTTIDSLKRELEIHRKRDAQRVDLLNELSFEYVGKDSEKTKFYLKESASISQSLNYKKGKAKIVFVNAHIALSQSDFDQATTSFNESLEMNKAIDFKQGVSECLVGLGIVRYYLSDYKEAIKFFKEALTIDKAIGNKEMIPKSLNNIGSAYSEMGDFERALNYYKKALTLNEAAKDTKAISKCYNKIGVLYDDQGNYPLALEYYNKALTIAEKLADTIGIANTVNNIGVIYKHYENYDKAIECYLKSLEIHKALGNERNVANVLNNLGIIYKQKGNYTKALEYYNLGLTIGEKAQDKDQMSICQNNIAEIYVLLKNNTKAMFYFEAARQLNTEIDDKRGLSISYLGIAKVYLQQKNYSEALKNALKSERIADELNMLNNKCDAHELLSEIYQKTGNYEKAFLSYQQYKILNDSIFNKRNIEKITELEYEYKYQNRLESARNRELKLSDKVAVTNKDLEKSQRNYFLAIIGVLLLSILLGSIIFYSRYRNVKSKIRTIIIEQKLLRSQMTPHFIFNSLSVLQGMILNKEDKKSVIYLSKFSKLLRIILENSRDKTVSLTQELEAIENYLALQNLENDSYDYTIEVDENVDVSLFSVPPMLIQPFVENAIEHAFIDHKENKIIRVHLSYLNKNLICTISDNGIGIDSQKVKGEQHKTSLSTTITNERLEMLSKDFKLQGTVTIEDRRKYNQQGTLVTIVIPYKIQAAR